jgi:hypothetical protein
VIANEKEFTHIHCPWPAI